MPRVGSYSLVVFKKNKAHRHCLGVARAREGSHAMRYERYDGVGLVVL